MRKNCDHKNLDFFDGVIEGERVKYWFCLDCDETIDYEPDPDLGIEDFFSNDCQLK